MSTYDDDNFSMNRRRFIQSLTALPLIVLPPKIPPANQIKITSEEFENDWCTDEICGNWFDNDDVHHIVIPGKYLASFKDSSNPLIYADGKFSITLTPQQAWEVAIDHVLTWTKGTTRVLVTSDYWFTP